jgi:DNA-binding GntR family transcriptional regulator
VAQEHTIPKTLSQSIYNYLKDSIINNKLKANQKINEKEIANHFQVSTTPVREAVLKLGAEGFVNINSHREAVVKEVSLMELKEIFQVLGTLDSLATGLAADNLNPEDMKKLEDLTKKMERQCQINSVEKYSSLNLAIHIKIWESLPNKFLKAALQNVYDQLQRYNYARFYAFRKPGVLERSLNEHKEILQALKNKDQKKLRTLMIKHWGSLLQPSPFEDGLKEYLNNEQKEVRITEKKRKEK